MGKKGREREREQEKQRAKCIYLSGMTPVTFDCLPMQPLSTILYCCIYVGHVISLHVRLQIFTAKDKSIEFHARNRHTHTHTLSNLYQVY